MQKTVLRKQISSNISNEHLVSAIKDNEGRL